MQAEEESLVARPGNIDGDCLQELSGVPVTLKIRISSLGKDVKLRVSSTDSMLQVKKRLEELHSVELDRVTLLFSGRVVSDKTLVRDLNIPKGFVIQAIVS